MAQTKVKAIRQTVSFSVSPEAVYHALMDSAIHSEFTGGKATISGKVGGKFSAWGGTISGKNLELKPGKRIVQEWYCQTPGWPAGHYSVATFNLQRVPGGTKLVFVQTRVPVDAAKGVSEGWNEYYWKPMKEYFSRPR